MKISSILDSNHSEDRLAKYFFSKAVLFAMKSQFNKAYEYFKEGLDLITCDCLIYESDWIEPYLSSNKKLFSDNKKDNTDSEYYFVKAYLMSFEDSNNFLNQALESIEKYLKKNKDEYGYYIKGKILISINEPNKAITYFNKAQKILDVIFEDDVDAKLLYRIGKTKEQFLNTNGISELYRSFIKNPRSICCARELKKYSRIRSLKTNANLEEERNELIKSFRGHTDELEFYKLYKNLLNNQRHLLKKRNGNNINEKTKKKIEDFIKFIQNNSLNLEGNIQSSESEENFDYYDSNFIEPDYDRDTFNALTDGQYGDYDEFDGDWDGLENWRGG